MLLSPYHSTYDMVTIEVTSIFSLLFDLAYFADPDDLCKTSFSSRWAIMSRPKGWSGFKFKSHSLTQPQIWHLSPVQSCAHYSVGSKPSFDYGVINFCHYSTILTSTESLLWISQACFTITYIYQQYNAGGSISIFLMRKLNFWSFTYLKKVI